MYLYKKNDCLKFEAILQLTNNDKFLIYKEITPNTSNHPVFIQAA